MKPNFLCYLVVTLLLVSSGYAQNVRASYSDEAAYKAITDKVKYPQAAIDAGEQGAVVLSFTISKRGELKNLNIDETPSMNLSLSAMEAFNTLQGKWNPATEDGEAVDKNYKIVFKYRTTIPINYAKSAQTSFQKGKSEKAIKMWTKAINDNPFSSSLYASRAEVYRAMGMEDKALADEQKAGGILNEFYVIYEVPSDGIAKVAE